MTARRSISRSATLAALALLLVPAGAATPARAATGGSAGVVDSAGVVEPAGVAGSGPVGGLDGDLLAVQMRLIESADRISASLPGTTGLAGITVEAELGELHVYWHGDVPPPVQAAIEAERRTVAVLVLEARHSQQQLLDAGMPILAEDGVSGVMPIPDGSGLLVSVEGDEQSAWTLPAIQSAPVPVIIEPHELPIFTIGRQQDTSPYSGGSSYHFPLPDGYTGICTTGFAVRVGAVSKILSAGHCRDDGDTVYEGNGSGPQVAMGTVSGTDIAHDTLLIDANSIGDVYYGPYTSVSSKPVHTVIGNYAKTLVCTSGAVTGQHCDIRITGVNQAIKIRDDNGGSITVFNLVRAEHIAKTVAAGEGDSGGPVVAQDSIPSGFLNVYPLGTITAIDGLSLLEGCGPTLMPTACSWRVYYADVNAALARYSATVVK